MNKKKLIILALILSMFTAAGCGETGTDNSSGENAYRGKIALWSAEDTVKVHRDVTYADAARKGAGIALSAVRNEYENAQIILTPEKDIEKYTVTLEDLTGTAGTFSKDNFKVYNQKYIEVKKTTTNSFTSGWYPDALLPFEKAEEYGENTVKAGENQGLYFECYIPKEQAAGTYAGSFTLTADGKEFSFPVSLKVYDYTLSDEVHSKSSFGIHRYWNEGGIVSAEKDASYEMYAAYYEYLLQHRISARYMPSAMEDIEGFVAQLRKYAVNGKCSNYILPYVSKWDNDFSGTGIDYDLYERQFDAIAEASVKDGVDYLEKASTYFAMFDEITAAGDIEKANAFYKKIYKLHFKIAQKWESSLDCPAEMKSKLIHSMLNLSQLMVTTYSDKFADQVTFCPLLDKYNTPASKDKYKNTYVIEDENSDYTISQNAEKWWYSAGIPKHPYASYHIDDNGYSPIVYSWMQYANDVVGNLYWSATFYLERVSENNKIVYNALQDCYSTAMRFPSTNGDGFLVYPGAPYGIYGPVGSIRLQQIADGLEEYDMLYALEAFYDDREAQGIDADFDGVMNLLYDKLFYGTKVNASESSYEEMRERLLGLLTLADKEGVVIAGADIQKDYADFKVYAPQGKEISFSGTKISQSVLGGGTLYVIRTPLTDTAGEFVVGAGGYTAGLPLGTKSTEYAGTALTGLLKANNGTLTVTEDGAHFLFPVSEGKRHSFNFQSDLLALVTSKISTLKLTLESDAACAVEVLFTGADGMAVPIYTGNLKEGANILDINTSSLNWNSLGTLSSVIVRFGELGDGKARNITVKSVILQ